MSWLRFQRPTRPFVFGLALAALAARAGDEPAKSDRAADHWKAAAAAYQITLEANPPRALSLRTKPVLHWNNPQRRTDDGASFVWLDRGRPEVIACFYRYKTPSGMAEDHEFMSLSAAPLIARRNGAVAWAPTKEGLVLEPIPDAPAPAATAAERLRQMRALAREFRAFFNNEPDRSEIRLLTQPLFRYEIETARTDILDGALFAFVQTTDPEVLLAIEARKPADGGSWAWHYGFARMSMTNLRAEHKGREVWSVQWAADLTNPSSPYMTRIGINDAP